MRRPAPPSVPRSGEPRLRPLTAVIRLPRRSPLYLLLARTLAAADALHGLRTDLGTVPVRLTATTRQSGCYRMREGDPIDLRISRRHERLALSLLHELGHLVDHQLAPEPRRFASTGQPAFKAWRAAARRVPSRAPARRGTLSSTLLRLAQGGLGAELRADGAPALGRSGASGAARVTSARGRSVRLAGERVRAARARGGGGLRAARPQSRRPARGLTLRPSSARRGGRGQPTTAATSSSRPSAS